MEIATAVPTIDVSCKKHPTPFSLFSVKGKARQSDEAILAALKVYNQQLGNRPCCINRRRSKTDTMFCNCLSVLSNEAHGEAYCAAVAECQFNFGEMTRTDQYKIFIEFIRGRSTYPLPFIVSQEEGLDAKFELLRSVSLCQGALMEGFGFGKDRWIAAEKAAKYNYIPGHKLAGKPPNNKIRFDALFGESLADHFANLQKEAGPMATRFVREKTGELTTRDNNKEAMYLDASLSRKGCYRRFCKELGEGPQAGHVDGQIKAPSWPAYLRYWNEHYPHLRVSRPAEDICSYCFVFQNQHKYKNATHTPDLFLPPIADNDNGGTNTAEEEEEDIYEVTTLDADDEPVYQTLEQYLSTQPDGDEDYEDEDYEDDEDINVTSVAEADVGVDPEEADVDLDTLYGIDVV